jgi:hypothetical protein
MHVAGTELCGQTIALAVEQQQRVITGGFEVPVVGTPDFLYELSAATFC